jgi:hypothetical protein
MSDKPKQHEFVQAIDPEHHYCVQYYGRDGYCNNLESHPIHAPAEPQPEPKLGPVQWKAVKRSPDPEDEVWQVIDERWTPASGEPRMIHNSLSENRARFMAAAANSYMPEPTASAESTPEQFRAAGIIGGYSGPNPSGLPMRSTPEQPQHKWTGCRRGGSPAEADSYEYVRYCEVCGIEDTCEYPLPPCVAPEQPSLHEQAVMDVAGMLQCFIEHVRLNSANHSCIALLVAQRELVLSEQQKLNAAESVCGEAYQLVGCLAADYPGVVPNIEKWLDNLSQCSIVHDGLLPVMLQPNKQIQAEQEIQELRQALKDMLPLLHGALERHKTKIEALLAKEQPNGQ